MKILPCHPPFRTHGITVIESKISTLRSEEIAVDDNNDPAPENLMQSDDVFPTASIITFGFHDVYPWRQSGNLPFGRPKLKTTPIKRIQHIYRLQFFIKLFFMDYIKNLIIPETKKRLNSTMNLSQYFCVIGFCLIMACYVVHSVRDFFLKYLITPQKGAPIHLNHIISGRRIDNITQVMSYKIFSIPEFNYPFF